VPIDTCYRCRLEDIPKEKRWGNFQAVRRGNKLHNIPPIPFVGILCKRCAMELGDWLYLGALSAVHGVGGD